MIKNIKYISDNGEILNERNLQFTDSMNGKGYRIPSHKKGVRCFTDIEFPLDMTDADIGKMIRLSKYLIHDNVIGDKNKLYELKEISHIISLSGRRLKYFLDKMITLKIIAYDGAYYVNPTYFMSNGYRITLKTFKLFGNELRAILPYWAFNEFIRSKNE